MVYLPPQGTDQTQDNNKEDTSWALSMAAAVPSGIFKIFEGVKYLSNYLEQRRYFIGNHFNIADVCGFSCLEYIDLRFPKFKWRDEHQNLDTYWNIHKDRQSFKETKPIVQIIEPLED